MDPVTLILTALATGAAASLQAAASDAMKESYNALKTLIQRKFAGKSKAEATLADYQDDPETYEKPLRKVLSQEQADQDKEIIEAAQKLMAQIDPEQAALGRYNIHIQNSQGVVIGERNIVNNTFGEKPKER